MIVVKSLFVGLTAAVVMLVVWDIVHMTWLIAKARIAMASSAGGFAGMSVDLVDVPGLVLAAFAFIAGALWVRRRSMRHA
jgi:hypothetical protein